MLRLEDRGLIYEASTRPVHERTACFTGLCRLKSGSVLASFQVGPTKQAATSTVKLCRSDDSGRTWRELPWDFTRTLGGIPGSLLSGEIVESPAGQCRIMTTWFDRSDSERPLFDPVTEGILRCKQLTATSADEGRSWSQWSEVPTPSLTGCAATGPILRWDDGTIAYAFESFKEYDDPAPARHAAWLTISRDGGRTFRDTHLVARDPEHALYFWDQRLCVAGPSGQYLALFWTHDRSRQQDIAVHLKRGAIDDASETLPVATSIPGQIAAPLLLSDGRILAFVVDRSRPGTMTLWQSSDDGRTWPEKERLVVYTHDVTTGQFQRGEQIAFAQYWDDMVKWTFGHPALRYLGNGRVLAAFYAGTPDCLSIHWARVAVE